MAEAKSSSNKKKKEISPNFGLVEVGEIPLIFERKKHLNS